MSLNGKFALVTGGSRGIGRGIALKLAAEGAKVAVHHYRNEKAANDTLAGIRRAGADGIVAQADVTKVDEVKRLLDRMDAEFGSLDIFVSNARPEAPEFFEAPLKITLDQWNTAFHSQATAFLVGAREAAKLMGDGGRILARLAAMGSDGCGQGGPGDPGALLRGSAGWPGHHGQLCEPRLTEDSVLNSLPPAAQGAIRDWHTQGWTPMRRLGTPEDIGNVVALLCREEAGWITGQLIVADGGASLMNAEVPPALQLGWQERLAHPWETNRSTRSAARRVCMGGGHE